MNNPKAVPRRIGLLGLGLLVMTLPACHSAGPWYRNQADGSSSVAYRPVYSNPRPFYVSGYGGADYSPTRPRRTVPACPVPSEAAAAPAPAPVSARVTVSQGSWDQQ